MTPIALAHELRTPLTAIRGFAELLATLDGPDDAAERHELVARLIRNTDRLQVLVDEMIGERLANG